MSRRTTTSRLRRLWLKVHLWLGIGLAVLLVPVALSGALLVWHDDLDALINPGRYAVTAGEPLRRPSYMRARRRGARAGLSTRRRAVCRRAQAGRRP